VENTENVHNVVVCTLCSCYPYDILGDTPWWYKHESYRTKIVQAPRATLEEMFNLKIPASKEVQVYDSTSDVRYFVLPERPTGTEAMSEEDLAKLVTVDSLIGAGEALSPAELAERGADVELENPRVRAGLNPICSFRMHSRERRPSSSEAFKVIRSTGKLLSLSLNF
jgi:hypothetical protein